MSVYLGESEIGNRIFMLISDIAIDGMATNQATVTICLMGQKSRKKRKLSKRKYGKRKGEKEKKR